MVRIGSYEAPTNIFLAPLAGCSDLPFRLIAREHGAGLCFYEMMDSHSLIRLTKKGKTILDTTAQDIPIAGQLLGADPSLMREAALIYLRLAPVLFIDINSACPVRKVVRKGAGAALLREPERLGTLVRTLARAVPVPVTVKLRTGFAVPETGLLETIARTCEDNGAAALFIHGRTQAQGYSGSVDYDAIRRVKQAVRIPVFGSGNVFSVSLARVMLDTTGCDGLLVARGAMGNPWIFTSLQQALEKNIDTPEPSPEQRRQVLHRHLTLIEELRQCPADSKTGIMRKVAIWYTKGIPHAAKLRQLITRAKNPAALKELIGTIWEDV